MKNKKNKIKMNFLYKAGFIILMLCIPMFAAAIYVAYGLEEVYYSAIFSGGGAFLAFLGIILTMFSKPKKSKSEDKSIAAEVAENIESPDC